MFAPASIPPRFRDAYARAERRLIHEVMVKSAWVVLFVSAITNGSVLIRGNSLIETDPAWGYGLRLPPLLVSIFALIMHYRRIPGFDWPLVMLRLISLSAMWSVFGTLVFAYDQGGDAFRMMMELSIVSIFCASLVSLRGLRGCLFPLFVPLSSFLGVMLYRGHPPAELLLNLLSFVSASSIAVLITHVLYRWRVSEFISRQQLNEMSTVDPLTGLMNRRAMAERLESERARYHRLSHSFAVILLDLDYFKRVNDEFGHQAGDRVLREIANRLKLHTRQQDCVARWGGEEFLVLLPDTEEQGAMTTAEKLRTALHEHPFEIGNRPPVSQTGSFGIAVYDGRESASRLIARADQALYMAKECGRNRVVVA
ncbi:diguanylate cyclase [Marinobacter lacisalsi]|uniref:diguanylate cyclase n=1 Tax=Marinobacter lacisalsi TaxID=475979 RepID=A0ABV8QQ59_9GAMM